MDTEASSEPDIVSLLVVLVTAMLFYYSTRIRSILTARVSKLVPAPAADPKVTQLTLEIKQLEDEVSGISPTAEFAAYFKKDRQLNKLRDELKTYLNSQDPQKKMAHQVQGMKIELGVQVLFHAVGFVLLYIVAGIHAFCIDWSVFWPVNHLLRFPSVFSSGDACGGPDSGLTPVSYFVLFYLFVTVVDTLLTGLFNSSGKIKEQ